MENIPNGYRTHYGDGNPNHYHIQRLELSIRVAEDGYRHGTLSLGPGPWKGE